MSDIHATRRSLSGSVPFASHWKPSRPYLFIVGSIFLIVAVERIGLLIFGTGRIGTLFIDALNISANLLAIAGTLAASRRDGRVSRLFWLLFGSALALQLFANLGWAYIHSFQVEVSGTALFPSLFYRLAAAPMAIALFLSDETSTSKLESFLDSCMVVGLVGLTTYQVQMAELNAHDPKIWEVITVGTVVNTVLLLVALSRFLLAAPGRLRSLFARQVIYLVVYFSVSFITSFADAYLPNADATVDLLWIVTYLSAAALALTWHLPAAQESPVHPRISRRTSLLCFNLTLATMVVGSAVLGLRLVDSTRMIGLIAVTIVLFSFAIRSALMQDTQERYLAALQESRAQLQNQAHYDELTGLPNRRLFAERLSQVLAVARRERQMVALLYVDLDGFKPVNDRLGHSIGDLLLKQVAHRMLARIRKSDTLVRMGGDEFTWLVVHIPTREQAAQLAEEMLLTISEPFEVEGYTIAITASIGIALFPEDATDSVSLIQQADGAMYIAKRDGKNRVRYCTPELNVL